MTEKQKLMKLIVENTCEEYGGNSRCDGDCFDRCEYCVTDIEVGVLANVLIDAGYRKASEVAEEIFAEIEKASVNWGCYCITTSKAGFLTEDVNRTLAELKKKYESEKEKC